MKKVMTQEDRITVQCGNLPLKNDVLPAFERSGHNEQALCVSLTSTKEIAESEGLSQPVCAKKLPSELETAPTKSMGTMTLAESRV